MQRAPQRSSTRTHRKVQERAGEETEPGHKSTETSVTGPVHRPLNTSVNRYQDPRAKRAGLMGWLPAQEGRAPSIIQHIRPRSVSHTVTTLKSSVHFS